MEQQLAKQREPASTGDASREEEIIAGLSPKARTHLLAILGDFLSVAANRDLLCPEFENGCCPNIPLEPLKRLFLQLRKDDAGGSRTSGRLPSPGAQAPRNLTPLFLRRDVIHL